MGRRRCAGRLSGWTLLLLLPAAVVLALPLFWLLHDDHSEVYHSEYAGSAVCGECHWVNHAAWKSSPHHNITRLADERSVVGQFDNGQWLIPEQDRKGPLDALPAIKTRRDDTGHYMAIRLPESDEYREFPVDRVVGYQYRQTYLTREPGGVLRRLPVQWSVPRGEFFAYWNEQEKSQHSVADLWAQMQTLNSAWNLYCGRCHSTHLQVVSKDPAHRSAHTEWTEAGVGCEACHGPGQAHVNYMQAGISNRIMGFIDNRILGRQAAYMMNASKQQRGVALSVCARCHGSDILRSRMDAYRTYEPGYDAHGRLNDLSMFFTEAPLQPGRTQPTVEVWPDGRPKGLGTLFRSFADSRHYALTDMRCSDCHDPHNNKLPARDGLLQASAASNAYCAECHAEIASTVADHSRHNAGQPGAFCYDCHMPKNILNQVSGVNVMARSHNLGSIPNPMLSAQLGLQNSPNACNDCHKDHAPGWALQKLSEWGMDAHQSRGPLHPSRSTHSDALHPPVQEQNTPADAAASAQLADPH